MPNMEALSETVQKLCTIVIFSLKKVTGQGHKSNIFI